MGQITTDQSHQVMATLAVNTNWSEIDFESSRLQELVIRHPKEAGMQFAAFLKNGGRTAVNVKACQVWKRVQLGTHRNVKALQQIIERKGFYLDKYAVDIMAQPEFTLADHGTTIDLVKVSVADLGFTVPTPPNEIFPRAIELGLSLCPAEVGPQLRIQYLDQVEGVEPREELNVAMEPILDSGKMESYFGVIVTEDHRLGLSAMCGNSADRKSAKWLWEQYVFALKR